MPSNDARQATKHASPVPVGSHPSGASADFFDGAHFVLLGGSRATAETLVRPTFRNWFEPHYLHVFSEFRCARAPA